MVADLFRGKLVHLVSVNPEIEAEAYIRWKKDSEYHRLVDGDPYLPRSLKQAREWLEKRVDEDSPRGYKFNISTLQDNRLIGFVGLWEIDWNHGSCWLGIGLGDREYWGKGYGTDALQTVLRYAFTELNLYYVALMVLAYNQRAIRSYEKCGFRLEGMRRMSTQREGKRWDDYVMGITRPAWNSMHANQLHEAEERSK